MLILLPIIYFSFSYHSTAYSTAILMLILLPFHCNSTEFALLILLLILCTAILLLTLYTAHSTAPSTAHSTAIPVLS